MIQAGLSINHFSAGYHNKKVINDIVIPLLPRGKITVLLGPNGCGKSTLMRSMAGLIKGQGKLLLNGTDLMQLPFAQRANKVVYLPQTLPEGIHLHVLESVIVAQRASGGHREQQHEMMSLLEQLGIGHLALHYLDQLSGGQKQLVGLAQSLIRQPELLLLDEPLSALDLNYQFHVMEQVKQETQQRDIVTLVVVHDINIALRHADHVIMLQKGKIIADGPPTEVITAESLAEVYGVCGRIECCSRGRPQVMIDGLVGNV